ncbi:unnamed protein product [Miscanthus lutarioriparius]|uniref:40S ribosomal protein S27 n=1 Tax=Miscanthus lutarioriparius TaxID=422564 RepID=A0A811MHV0_9POAL|nr:unnamed protein product [Miscanthus lutarioriparius]
MLALLFVSGDGSRWGLVVLDDWGAGVCGVGARDHGLVASPVLQNDIDLVNPPAELEKLKHKKKRLVQSPNSFFMDVKCQGCFSITTMFSHSQTVVVCLDPAGA